MDSKELSVDFAWQFTKECNDMFANAKTPDDIRRILVFFTNWRYYHVKHHYNEHIGWALPSAQVCAQVVGLWQKYPSARIVDLGAGSGVFCMMFHDAGVPTDKLLAIDKETPVKCWQTTNTYWPITRDDAFDVPIRDILFLAWGGGDSNLRLDSYIKRGGWCVVILGELGDGCTFPSDYLVEDEEWESTIIHVDSPAFCNAEHLSINIRRVVIFLI